MERERTVELDWAADSSPEDRLGEATALRLGLTVEVVEAHGPGSGWPTLRFSGPDALVDQLVGEYTHDFEDVDGDRFFHDVRLTQDEVEAIQVDGRDGVGEYVAGTLNDPQYAALAAYREVRELLGRLPPHEADVLRDSIIEISMGETTRPEWDRNVAWATEALGQLLDELDADERARRQAAYDDEHGDPLPDVGADF